MVIFSIALGIAVDDTIHIMAAYRERIAAGDRPDAAMADAVHTTGRAVVITTICLAIGFFLQSLSSLPQLVWIGALGGFVVVAAMLADLWLLPALVSGLHRPGRQSRHRETRIPLRAPPRDRAN